MEHNNETPLLSVEHLSIDFGKKENLVNAVEDISFTLSEGEILGIVGESGSGKSVTALSILRLLSKEGKISGGKVLFGGQELLSASEKEMQQLRGSTISMVFQEPMTSLNPVLTIGKQLEEILVLHEKTSEEERKTKILSILEEVGLQQGETLLKRYPHELSGGMRQRVMIAMAMLCKPKLLIADEPTTALDVTIQAKILDLLKKMNEEHGTAILLISHNLEVIKRICNRGIVMYQGKIEEIGTITDLFERPKREYTEHLLKAVKKDELSNSSKKTISELNKNDSYVRTNSQSEEILNVSNLSVFYEQRQDKLFAKQAWKEAVKGVSFSMKKGEILGVVGESGSGKSSLVKAIANLQPLKKGSIELKTARPQMVFQDPYSSLNPAKRIGWLLEEPMKVHKTFTKEARKTKVEEMLTKVGLAKEFAMRYPSELSGGQRQRVAIAIAMIMNHDFIILDEPVSALDVTVQAQILELLMNLRKEYVLSYLFVSHDMSVIQKICDRVLVMYEGEIVEMGEVGEVFNHPKHQYTKQLLKAML